MYDTNLLRPQIFIKNNWQNLLQQYRYSLKEKDIVPGTIFSQERHGYLVNLGMKTSAYLPRSETHNCKITEKKEQNYYTREYIIIKREKRTRFFLSTNQLDYIKSWERIQQLYSEDLTVCGNIIRKNKGGLLVNVEGITSFVPNSHNIPTFNNYPKEEIATKIILKFLEINETNNYIILSYKRVILQSYRDTFNLGQVIKGTVQNIKEYGVFVDIGNITGLLHISEITKDHVKDLNKFFKVGAQITVSIVHLDTKQGRISLSTKFLDQNISKY
nr:ribosomal protein S1 [Porphyropsis coccinea]